VRAKGVTAFCSFANGGVGGVVSNPNAARAAEGKNGLLLHQTALLQAPLAKGPGAGAEEGAEEGAER